jgi:hypothetical protein
LAETATGAVPTDFSIYPFGGAKNFLHGWIRFNSASEMFLSLNALGVISTKCDMPLLGV